MRAWRRRFPAGAAVTNLTYQLRPVRAPGIAAIFDTSWLELQRAMASAAERICDWRDGAAYRALLSIDQAGLAWEWLRRDPAYVAFAAGRNPPSSDVREDPAALPWGLHFRGRPAPHRARSPLALECRA